MTVTQVGPKFSLECLYLVMRHRQLRFGYATWICLGHQRRLNMRHLFSTITALAISACLVNSLLAFETDQFNLPPDPLADIGDEVSEHLESSIRSAVAGLNSQIKRHEKCGVK